MFEWFKKVKKITTSNTGKLCDCTGDLQSIRSTSCEGFPLKGGYHTAFVIGTCKKCNGFFGFPQDNLELAIKDGTESGIEALKEYGFDIDNIQL